jgi:hypothetical protein
MYAYKNKHSLRSNTKDYGGKTHQTDSQNSDTTAHSGRELYHLQFSLQAASPETSGHTLVQKRATDFFHKQLPRFDSRRGRGRDIFSLPPPPDQLWDLYRVPGVIFPGIKQRGREADHSHPSSAEAKNEWNYTSTPTCLHYEVLG